jgi:hypothetical protein
MYCKSKFSIGYVTIFAVSLSSVGVSFLDMMMFISWILENFYALWRQAPPCIMSDRHLHLAFVGRLRIFAQRSEEWCG